MRTPIPAAWMGAAVLVALSTAPASAQDDYDFTIPAFYLTAQGTNNIGGFRSNPESDVSTNAEHSMGAGGAFGYRIDDHFAAEIQGEWVHGFDAKTGLDKRSQDIVGGSVTANVKYYLTTDRWQPYGLLGLGAGFFKIRSENDTTLKKTQADLVLRFGGGLDFWFTDQVGTTFDISYIWPTGASDNIDDLDYVRIGWGFTVKFVTE